jgi:hypothetical protein
MPVQVTAPGALERVLNHRGIVTCRLLPAIKGTVGIKVMLLVELAPVVKLVLLNEHPVIIEGQNCTVDCPVATVLLEASLINTMMFSAAPVPPPQGLVITN